MKWTSEHAGSTLIHWVGPLDTDFDPLGTFSTGPELQLDRPSPAGVARPVSAAKTRHAPPEEAASPSERAYELAEHGDAPELFLDVPYAIGVLRRNRALRQKIPELERLRDVAEADLEVATLALGRALHGQREHPKAGELGKALRIANARHHRAGGYEADLTRERDEARATTAELQASITRFEGEASPLRMRARELSAQVVVFQQDFEAVSTTIHGITRELTALEKQASPDANRRIELEAKRTLERADAEAAVAEIDARTPELGEAEARIAELESSISGARAEIAATSAGLAETEARLAVEAADVKEAFERALVELADEGTRLRLDYVIVPTAAKLARLRYDTFVARTHEIEMHELALTLYHPSSLKRGLFELVLLVCAPVVWMLYTVLS